MRKLPPLTLKDRIQRIFGVVAIKGIGIGISQYGFRLKPLRLRFGGAVYGSDIHIAGLRVRLLGPTIHGV